MWQVEFTGPWTNTICTFGPLDSATASMLVDRLTARGIYTVVAFYLGGSTYANGLAA